MEKIQKNKKIRFKNKISSCKSDARYHERLLDDMFCHQFYMVSTSTRGGLLNRGSKNMSFGLC